MTKLNQYIQVAGIVFTSLGALLKVMDHKLAVYLFGLGAACLLYHQIMSMATNKTTNSLARRHGRNGLIATVILAAGVYFMYKESNSWVVTTLMYAIITFYLSFREPSRLK